MKILYIVVSAIFVALEGFFPYHWHGFVNKIEGKRKTYKEIIKELTPLFIFRDYVMNISFAIIGWIAGYYLIFNREVFNDDPALLIAAFVVFLLGASGYLPYFITQRLGSLK